MDDLQGLEQLEKRVEWLDNERRNDKTNIASILNRLTVLESENNGLRQQNKEMSSEITRLTTLLASMDKYDNRIDRLTSDLTQRIKDVEERLEIAFTESGKRLKLELDATNKSVNEIFPFTETLPSIQSELKSCHAEDIRLARIIEEVKQKVSEVNRFDEDYKRSLHLLEESRRQDTKRLTDLQGEVVAQRKRLDESRSRVDLMADNFRQIDNRFNELQSFEKDRKEAQSAYFEKINMQNLERDRIFKEWRSRFEAIEKINVSLDSQFEALDNMQKSVNKSLAGVEDVTQRFERRINEISEIQRLNDERFRQEWTAFKSDDLKRWTNYMLGQDEQWHEVNRQINTVTEQLTELDELTKTIQDAIQQTNQETLKRLQTLLRAYQDSLQGTTEIGKRNL